MRLTIYWTKEAMHKPSDGSPRMYDRIVKRFGFSDYISINGETPVDVKEIDLPDLKVAEERWLHTDKKQVI